VEGHCVQYHSVDVKIRRYGILLLYLTGYGGCG
jgi:hypothetical protein